MKLRKTIYPFALIIAIPLVLLVFYVLNQGKFEKVVHTELSVKGLQETDVAVLQYGLEWKGFRSPQLTSVTFWGEENMDMTAFIENAEEGSSEEKEIKEVEPNMYEIDVGNDLVKGENVSIILKAPKDEIGYIINNPTLHIKYKTFGITREQDLQIDYTG